MLQLSTIWWSGLSSSAFQRLRNTLTLICEATSLHTQALIALEAMLGKQKGGNIEISRLVIQNIVPDYCINVSASLPAKEVEANHVADEVPAVSLTECASQQGVKSPRLDAIQRCCEVAHGK